MHTAIRIAMAVAAILLTWTQWAGTALADKRVALVIGNSAYQHTPKLDNPKNDAADIAATLKQLGFEVSEGRDLDKTVMERTIRNFALTLAGARMAVFYYAGDGVQVGGQNYLVPIDAQLTAAIALDFEMVRLDLIQRTMEREVATNIFILDACRDNPLARNLARALGTRSTSVGRGLAAMESGEGTLISFSTQPGNVALDGAGRNSPFAAALLKHIVAPGEDLPTILINVRNDVMAATERRQVPWEHSSLTAKVYFTLPKPAAPPADLQRDLQVELTFWGSVKDSSDPTVLGTYLQRYPDGEFAPIARALIDHYERQDKAAVAAREEARKREEEVRKAAQVKRIEEEQRLREATAAAELRRAKEGDAQAATRLEEQQRAELSAQTQLLQKAVEEARKAREDAKAAETQRLAAVKAAEQASKAAEEAIAKKRDAEKTSDPAKIAALPKLETPRGLGGSFDGNWTVNWQRGGNCRTGGGGSFRMSVTNGAVGGRASGRVAANGAARWTVPAATDGAPVRYDGILQGNTGSGSFIRLDGKCSGSFTARKG